MSATVLVPLDGSPLARAALPFASYLARESGSRLVLLHVEQHFEVEEVSVSREWIDSGTPRPATAIEQAARQSGRADLEQAAELLRKQGIGVQVSLVEDDEPGAAIVEAARHERAELIVMATHGRSGLGRWIYGSIADEVIRQTTVPLLLIPAGRARVWEPGRRLRMLVTLDGSELSEAILEPAGRMAELLDADVVLVSLVEPPNYAYHGVYPYLSFEPRVIQDETRAYLESLARDPRLEGRVVCCLTDLGHPPSDIAALARREDAGLIAMATHGRGGLLRLVLGSVATGTIQRASIPVLLVRPTAVPRRREPAAAIAGNQPTNER